VPDAGVTAAVKVRLVPATALVADAVSVVVVARDGAVTATVTAADVEVLYVVSPE
jgi:hypothetical protein